MPRIDSARGQGWSSSGDFWYVYFGTWLHQSDCEGGGGGSAELHKSVGKIFVREHIKDFDLTILWSFKENKKNKF